MCPRSRRAKRPQQDFENGHLSVFANNVFARISSEHLWRRHYNSRRYRSYNNRGFLNLRRQSLDPPRAIRFAAILKSIVESISPSLPEFNRFRRDSVAAPKWR